MSLPRLGRKLRQSHTLNRRLDQIVGRRTAWRGRSVIRDIGRSAPLTKVEVVVDVGAHRGQSAMEFATRFPCADVYAMEPVSSTFGEMADYVAHHPRIHPLNLAGSASDGTVEIMATTSSPGNRVMKEHEDRSGVPVESVEAVTLTTLRKQLGVDSFDFVKIDAEGHDMEVLRGGEALLRDSVVGFVQVECGLSSTNTFHCGFREVWDYLSIFGYEVFGVYNQTNEFQRKSPVLRRADVVFIGPTEIANNEGLSRLELPMYRAVLPW